jgi:HK97 family phage prohead protease
MSTVEIRYAAELRTGAALGGNDQGEEMVLEGYAARFNQPSKDLGGFRETIKPGAFRNALANKSDVRCLFNHDASKVLGRTQSGTLTLAEDENGLKFRCQLDPNNTEHRNLYSSVKRQDVSECSFAFTPDGPEGDYWDNVKDEGGNWFISRELRNVNLFDVSAVTHPAYAGTNVDARCEAVTPEIRGIMSKLIEKRTKTVETRDKSFQDMLNCLSKCLCDQFPCEPDENEYCSPCGMYWMCDTYDNYIIASKDGPGPSEYVKIPYVQNPDGDGYVFGTPTPVEKDWVPSERAKSVNGEMRAMNAAHMQAIADRHIAEAAAHKDAADAHSAAAADHTDHAQAHSEVADAAQTEADKMARCEATRGDCSVKGCRCQNQMIAARDMDDDYEDYEDFENDDEEQKNARRSARKSAENRGGPGSGPRPGEGARTQKEHLDAAKVHEKSAEDAKKQGYDREAKEHMDAAKAHTSAAKAVDNASASSHLSGDKQDALKKEADSASSKANAASHKANWMHEADKVPRNEELSAENRGGPGSGPRAGAGSVSKEKDAAESAKTTEEHIAAAKYHTDESMHKHGDDMDKSVKHGQAAMAHLKAAVSGKEKDSEIAHEYSKAARSENKATELRDDDSSKVRTKMVGGKALPAGAFAVVGDPNDTSTWKLPIHDKAHADNAAARLNQTDDIDKEAADKKIKAAQKKFGESPDDARAFKEQMELRFRLSMLATEIQ